MELQLKKKALWSLLLLVALMGLLASGGVEGAQVTITNRLNDNSPATIHCKSKDDDIGEHVVGVGQTYIFKFNPNFWGTTLFSCSFRSKYGSIDVAIYREDRDLRRCPLICDWRVTAEGLVGSTDESPPKDDLKYSWTK